jgi:4-amino-4-deoxy-L-arabinose transferase-like glycosyltransferase
MMMNWHNFFFVSFDPGGFITIDKPPLGFWLQTISAQVFGFQGWSIILPQALGGVISVYLIYILVKRYHGEWAGLIAALVLALTPIFVAASRNNTIDVMLVMTLLFSVLVFLPATEELSLKKLLLAFFLIGVGFNIKSLEAFLILPAFYLTYLFTQPGQYQKKAIHLLVATIVLLFSCLPWFIAVDSIPSDDRPYVGSSETNSELELATGYNGLSHFLGRGVRTPGRQRQAINQNRIMLPNGMPVGVTAPSNAVPSAGTMRQQGGESGLPGLFRLFNHQMGGQISWLLPFALSGLGIALYQNRRQAVAAETKRKLLFWGCWLIPQVIFFSIAQGAHRYYLVMMAPAIAALVGISYSTLANWLIGTGKKRYLLPGAILLTIGVQASIIAGYDEWRSWMLPLVLAAGVLAVILLGWQVSSGRILKNKYHHAAAAVGLISLLIAPFAWSITPVLYSLGNAAAPFAGPDLHTQLGQSNTSGGNFSGRFTFDTAKLETFLMSHRKGEKYIAAVPNAHIASSIILDTGEQIITYGGFAGSEKILNAESLEELVASQQVRYVLLGSSNSQQTEVDGWVSAHGTLVPDAEWQTEADQENLARNGGTPLSRRMPMHLYECHL